MEKSLKKGSITKEVEVLKNNEARDLGVQDFFTARDKSKRKTQGLVEDSSQVLGEETKAKQELYDKSMEVDSMPDHIVPLFSGLFLTARRNKLMQNGLYLPTASFGKGSDTDMDQDFSDTQIVLSAGPYVNQISPGMEVVLNMNNFKKPLERTVAQKIGREFEYVLPIEVIDGIEYLYITERDVKYISNTNKITIKPIEQCH
jgi:hypothetical protein